ncbi:MAG: molecular chaperone HtpG [Opitutales bacterium]|nr:molecular chaperone HtpG [Opitutales bacterium]MCH8541755.1 molecular chaperone HtpG [Opitutales bacterium]
MSTATQPEKHSFQAEVQQLLDIVIHSLYTDKEIFVRELTSNASDALEKLRHLQITEKNIHDDRLPLEVNITTDENGGTFTIQDFGIGMTREELVENLGTIAHSGSKAFLQAIKESGQNNENLIGQFGVGFYSAFMVAKQVKVYTRSWHPEATGYCWTSEGKGEYSIEEAEGQRRGTKIVIELMDEAKEFAKDARIKDILRKYSSFVPFPVNLNGEKVNTVQALWLRSKNEISEDEYKEFYKFACNAFDEPRYRLHFSADAPIALNSLLFVPGDNMERMGMERQEPGVALYCRKILIDPHPKGLLPEWLRFLKGVVDSEDLPLNISRETMQDSALIQKIGRLLTKRMLKYLEEESRKNVEDYEEFFTRFGFFLKEGAATDFTHKDQIVPLLRFESSLTEPGQRTTLAEYIDRAKEEQKEIYYLVGPNRKAIENGPYLEAFKARNLEVLFLYESVDEFVMNNLQEYQEKKLVSADRDDLDLGDVSTDPEARSLEEAEVKSLAQWFRDKLGDRVAEVSGSNRLVDSPALVLNTDKMMSASMRRMMKAMGQEGDLTPKVNLQLNPRHPLILNLSELRNANEGLAAKVAEQIFDNAMIAAGLLDDPRPMVDRIYQILEEASKKE